MFDGLKKVFPIFGVMWWRNNEYPMNHWLWLKADLCIHTLNALLIWMWWIQKKKKNNAIFPQKNLSNAYLVNYVSLHAAWIFEYIMYFYVQITMGIHVAPPLPLNGNNPLAKITDMETNTPLGISISWTLLPYTGSHPHAINSYT